MGMAWTLCPQPDPYDGLALDIGQCRSEICDIGDPFADAHFR